jgi:TPR repeat protein
MRAKRAKFKHALAAVILVLSFATPVVADPLEDGSAAYRRGDYVIALKLLRPLAEQGVADAENMLGHMYERGWGVTADFAEAVKWYRLAANQGIADAQVKLGIMYYTGQGVGQDYVRAYKWFSLSAAQGSEHGAVSKKITADNMTRAQIAEAQKLVREWKPTKQPIH